MLFSKLWILDNLGPIFGNSFFFLLLILMRKHLQNSIQSSDILMKHQMLSFQNIETKSAVHWCNSVGDSYRETTAVQFNQDGCYNFRTKPNQKLLKAKPVSGSAAPVRAHWPSFLLVTVGGSAEGAEQQPFQSNMAAAFATRSRIFQMYLSSSLAKFLPRSALINGPLLSMRTN